MKPYAIILLLLGLAACTTTSTKIDCNDITPPLSEGMLQISNTYQEQHIYGGWELYTYNPADGTTTPALVWPCRKGNNQGERPDHYYCGDQKQRSWIIYAKRSTVQDGVITGVERQSFLAEYDSRGVPVASVCVGRVLGPDESAWN